MNRFRFWVTVITLAFLAVVVYFSYPQIIEAFKLLGNVKLWIFLLILPIQLISYYAIGESIFSYLKSKGELDKFSWANKARIALELNFVNHVIPIPSIAGFSYLGWILKHHGVNSGRATMAQIIRFMMTFVTYISLIVIALAILAFSRNIDLTMLIASSSVILVTIISVGLGIYCVSNKTRLVKFANWLARSCNKVMRLFSRSKTTRQLKVDAISNFLLDLHDDYLHICRDKQILKKPFLWSLLGNVLDVSMTYIVFISLGFWINPAILVVAYGAAATAAIFFATPGGTGAYEAIMIAFIASSGVPLDVAIAGTLLTRATVFTITILFGYIFYQTSINKYGKVKPSPDL